MELDIDDLTPRERSRIVKSAVTPRPIAWISTVDEEGADNLAPFSSYNYVSSSRPVVLFNSPTGDAGGLKDTARNALVTGEFAVNVVTEPHLEQMDHTSAPVPANESEFDLASVRRAECRRIDAPRVADAAVTMECTLYDSISIHDRLMVLGVVQYFHVAAEVLTDDEIDMTKLETVGRLGGPYYTVATPGTFKRRF
ncbi:flavin reductase family protein [Halomarina halobia]|uniref:Flavin reductase family protein n=1 Tax=Halomarina halobia TaxID=3033386 RepID=A0ABD6AEM1_9EURY|nr:flavin reductase family protein [Halomarina sp. PSR21]